MKTDATSVDIQLNDSSACGDVSDIDGNQGDQEMLDESPTSLKDEEIKETSNWRVDY